MASIGLRKWLAVIAVVVIVMTLTGGVRGQPAGSVEVVRLDQSSIRVTWDPPGPAVLWRQRGESRSLVGVATSPPVTVTGGDVAIRLEPCDRVWVVFLDEDGVPSRSGSVDVPSCIRLPIVRS